MKRVGCILSIGAALYCALTGPAQATVDPENVEVIVVPAGDKFLRWQGQVDRVYFIQTSDPNAPLVDWLWMSDLIDQGTGIEISHEILTTADKAFFRVWHTDDQPPVGVSLEEWDADDDGLSNEVEISATVQTNPLSADTDGDGLEDGWEVDNGLDPNDATGENGGSGNPDADGWTNLQEQTAGTNPKDWDTDRDGLADDTDTDPLANNAIADPDGEGLPTGFNTALRGRWDFESQQGSGYPVIFPDLSGAGRNASSTSGGPQGDGMPSLAGRIGPGSITVPTSIVQGVQTWTISGWLKVGEDTITTSNGIYRAVFALYDLQGTGPAPQNAPLGQGTGLFVRTNLTTGDEDWFVGGYQQTYYWNEYPQTNGNPKTVFNGHYFTLPAGTTDDGHWRHFAVTRSTVSNGQKVYFNGELVFEGALRDYPVSHDSDTTFTFGALHPAHWPTAFQDACIDRVSAHARLLTASDVADLYQQDIDHDGLWDITEARSLLWRDDNTDGIRTADETDFTMSPFHWDDPNSDHDDDGIISLDEQNVTFTNAAHPDSDGDLLPDGWEVDNGLDPNDSTGNNGASGDNENGGAGDGVTNLNEFAFQTNPNSADSDGDGTSDAAELAQGSHPGDARDGGQPIPADERLSIKLGVGDRSGSQSEDYVLNVFRIDPQTGQESATPYFVLRSGGHGVYSGDQIIGIFRKRDTYSFQIDWQSSSLATGTTGGGSDPEGPDYDYHMVVELQDVSPGVLIDSWRPDTGVIDLTTPILDPEDIFPAQDDDDDVEDFPNTVEKRRVLLLVPELDVNGDGDLADAVDGLKDYLPGYEGSAAKLHTGTSFTSASYSGPQSMKLILPGVGTGSADAASFSIIESSNWFGYCSNGTIPGEMPLFEWDDFSFDATSNLAVISGAIDANQIWAPLHCKDYGAFCEVEISLTKGGSSVLPQTLRVTVPHDGNGDKLADVWQDSEIAAWNTQFGASRPLNDTERDKMKPGAGDTYADYADDEEADSDGSTGRLDAMADAGDALSVIEEYRGYVLDLGTGLTAGEHKRMGTARKEVLLQIHEMPEITNAAQNNANAAAQQFDMETRFQEVANFYVHPTKGAELDLYAVSIPVIDAGPSVQYLDGTSRPTAYKWTGKLAPITGSTNTRPATGGSYVYRDRKLEADFPLVHENLYESYVIGLPGRLNIFPRLRDYDLPNFGVCVMFTRLGAIEESIGVLQAVENSWGNATTNHASTAPDPTHERRGVQISVNAISEEASPAYSPTAFNDLLDYAFAHELGHMLIWSQHGGHYGTGQTLMSDVPPSPKSLTPITIANGEVQLIELRNRLSIQPHP